MPHVYRVFSRNVVFFWGGGGIVFVGRENVKNIQKTNKLCYYLGGNLKLRGEISPLKALKKNTACLTSRYWKPVQLQNEEQAQGTSFDDPLSR